MRQPRPKFYEFPINPMQIPAIRDRQRMITQYAERYLNHSHVHESLDEYCDQAAADLMDKTAKLDVKREIRRLRRGVAV